MDRALEGLQAELSLAYTNFYRVIQQLEPDKRCQSGVSGHWSPKDIVSHLIGWDTSLQKFIADPDGFDPDPLYDIHTFNATSVSARHHQSWEETIDELQNSYRDLQKAITTVTAGIKIYARVSEWLKGRREDYEFHTHQMEEWIEQNGVRLQRKSVAMEHASNFEIKTAEEQDVGLIFMFIKELAKYERLSHTVVATENSLRQWLFGERPIAEVILGYKEGGEAVGFALFFHNFSTFQGKPGLYLEDLYVKPEYRGKGLGQQFLRYLAKLAKERDCGRFEWTVLDWNEPAIQFYKKLGVDLLEDWRICRVTGGNLARLAVGSEQ